MKVWDERGKAAVEILCRYIGDNPERLQEAAQYICRKEATLKRWAKDVQTINFNQEMGINTTLLVEGYLRKNGELPPLPNDEKLSTLLQKAIGEKHLTTVELAERFAKGKINHSALWIRGDIIPLVDTEKAVRAYVNNRMLGELIQEIEEVSIIKTHPSLSSTQEAQAIKEMREGELLPDYVVSIGHALAGLLDAFFLGLKGLSFEEITEKIEALRMQDPKLFFKIANLIYPLDAVTPEDLKQWLKEKKIQ